MNNIVVWCQNVNVEFKTKFMAKEIPITGIITLSSTKEDWGSMLSSGVREFKCTGIIEREGDTRAKVNIVITNIIEPKTLCIKASPATITSFDANTSDSISKISVFAHGFIEKATWMLFGYIDGLNKTPFVIIHYVNINLSVYTLKPKDEVIERFYPQLN